MSKIWSIARKDLVVTLRDPAALVMLLVTPFALTLAIAFAFGGLSGGNAGLADIPVTMVNHDTGDFGKQLVDVLHSPDLDELLAPSDMTDDATARAEVDADRSAAVVIIPAGFSESIMPAGVASGQGPQARTQSVVELYANPSRPISASVVRSIVEGFISRAAAGAAGGQVAATQLVMSGAIDMQQAMAVGQSAGRAASGVELIGLSSEMAAKSGTNSFDWLTYMAPSMAILFVMFTATAGARSILAERDTGTLPRMLATPTTAAQVIGGKVGGLYLTGVAQVGILVLASGLIFGVKWGQPLAVVLVVLVLVAAATGWGMVIAAFSRSPGQANATGTMLTLIFAAMAGNFVPRQLLPSFIRTASYISPNAWGLEAFGKLTSGGGLPDVVVPLVALAAMTVVLFGVAVVAFRRQYA